MQKHGIQKILVAALLMGGMLAGCGADEPYRVSREEVNSPDRTHHDTNSNDTTTTDQNEDTEKNPEIPALPPSAEGNGGNTAGDTNSPDTPAPASEAQACVIPLQDVTLQMQISSQGSPPVVPPVVSVNTGFYPIPDISLTFENGGRVVRMQGKDFPRFSPYLGEKPSAVLEIYASPDTESVGSFDPGTGELSIADVHLLTDVFFYDPKAPQGKGAALGTMTKMPAVTFSTMTNQKATGNGDPKEITVSGKPYDPATREVTVATALTIPAVTGAETVVDASIGGGALTAVIHGKLSQDPTTCGQ